MKLALVTTARADASAVGAYSAALALELAKRVELTLFVEPQLAGGSLAGLVTRRADELIPRAFDQVLYQIGDEAQLAFMAPMVRALGGAVAMHDWALFEFACAANPSLSRGGWRALVTAAREGGLAQAAQLRRRCADPTLAAPVLNRSIVRFADAYATHSEALGRAILDDRNAPTPIGVLEPRVESGGAAALLTHCAANWDAVAARYVELLERFPRPRTARKSLIALQLAALSRKRALPPQ